MFDIHFTPDQPYGKQLLFTTLHGACLGVGLGVGVALMIVLLGWLHLLPRC